MILKSSRRAFNQFDLYNSAGPDQTPQNARRLSWVLVVCVLVSVLRSFDYGI